MRLDVKVDELKLLVAAMLALGLGFGEVLHHLARFVRMRAINDRVPVVSKTFSLAKISPALCKRLFRFLPDEIAELDSALRLQDTIYSAQSVPVPRQEALCILLRRLAFPSRHDDLVAEFGRSPEVISSVANIVARIIYNKIKTKMEFDHRMVNRYKQRSAEAIFAKVGRLTNCLGFIDGTVRRICRPTRHQRQAYSGHKKMHAIKFQSVIMANGLIVSLYGPVEGRRHDGYMLRASEIEAEMREYPEFLIYGDQGYPLRSWLIVPYAGAVLTNAQKQFNFDLSKARIAVEWGFGWIVRYWKYFTLPNNMKVLKSPVGLLYVVAAFLTNCLSCVRRRNQSSKYFRCTLPTLHTYLADLDGGAVNEDDYSSDEDVNFYEDESDLSSDSGSDTSSDGSDTESDIESDVDSEIEFGN